MPTISTFYGVSIRMYWNDHAPPHFHAVYADDEAVYRIEDALLIRGALPPRAHAMTLEWAIIHRLELLENWQLCATRRQPNMIPPLD